MHRAISIVAVVALLPTVKYYLLKDEKMENAETNSQFQQSQKEKELENVPNILMEQEKEFAHMTRKIQPQCTKLNMTDGLFFEPAFTAISGSMPLDTVFILLLIHTCGVCHHMSLGGVLVDMALSLILAAFTMYRWKREKAESVKRNAQLQKESLKTEEEREDVVNTLMELNTELENQRGRLKELLEEVEGEREVNKQNLQAVEKEITEREAAFDKPEELLREKEDLLRTKWKLDQTKKDNERQLLNTERLLEPIEIQINKIHRKKEVDFG
ncbi:uncharacterized protein LOC116052098 isoform X2 [Sander lucioperca]|uniref:uncharacterized protein LOC116052098 isoform X2 n=1 Tax=Sander lucioperca TaxID=283035 RepID=UPI00125E7585|nr:uncharacterized protein LOC116052098 isoform X2 [Sander lucioperca]